MPKLSAGVLLYRARAGVVDVLLAHPGGPFWAGKDDGAWSIPKGEYTGGEDPWLAARREFSEEIGLCVPDGPRIDFGSLKQSGGKVVTVFGVRADLDITDARSSTFELTGRRARARCVSSRGRPGELVSGSAGTHQTAQGAAGFSRPVDGAPGRGGFV